MRRDRRVGRVDALGLGAIGERALEAGRVPGGEQRLRVDGGLRRRTGLRQVEVDQAVGAPDVPGAATAGGGGGRVGDLCQLNRHIAPSIGWFGHNDPRRPVTSERDPGHWTP